MILTNTIKKPFFIPSNSQFVKVEVFEIRGDRFNDSGEKVVCFISTEIKYINLSLISVIKPTNFKSYRENAINKFGSQWTSCPVSRENRQYLDDYPDIYEITKIHDDINMHVDYVKFLE